MSKEIEIENEKHNLIISTEEDVKLMSAFLTTFPHSTMKNGCLMQAERIVGLSNKDYKLKIADDKGDSIDPSFLPDVVEILMKAKIRSIKFVQKDGLPLQIIPRESNLQILVATLTMTD